MIPTLSPQPLHGLDRLFPNGKKFSVEKGSGPRNPRSPFKNGTAEVGTLQSVLRAYNPISWFHERGIHRVLARLIPLLPDVSKCLFLTFTVNPELFDSPKTAFIAARGKLRKVFYQLRKGVTWDGKLYQVNAPYCVKVEFHQNGWAHFHVVFLSRNYQTLLYTGQRRTEVASLVWSDLDTVSNYPSALFRDGTMKDKEKRAVPLHVHLAAALHRSRPAGAHVDDLVFPAAPTYETLRCDLARASIEHKDALGRVVHFHAFRKTFQTMGVRAGINQRSAQALLGHSDPALTANAYTDVAALELHAEVAKLTWLTTETDAQLHAQKVSVVVRKRRIAEIVAELIDAAKSPAPSEDTEELLSVEVAARHGFEP